MKTYLNAVPPYPARLRWSSRPRRVRFVLTMKPVQELPDDLTLAYLAGLIDGDGNIFIRRRLRHASRSKNPSFSIGIKLTNTDRATMEWLREMWAGGWSELHAGKNPKWRKHYEWRTECGQARHLLEAIEPFLRIKKRQAQIAIRLQKLVEFRPKGLPLRPEEVAEREALWAELHAQEGRGGKVKTP